MNLFLSDIDLVGRLTIDDVRVDGFKLLKGFEIFATKEILKVNPSFLLTLSCF